MLHQRNLLCLGITVHVTSAHDSGFKQFNDSCCKIAITLTDFRPEVWKLRNGRTDGASLREGLFSAGKLP
jgi:hypothetical protein